MEIRHLRYFIAVADEKSFTKAAARLHVSQPSLSRQVRDLEETVGAALLTRSTLGVELTQAGVEFLAGARRVVEDFECLAVSLREYGSHNPLKVGYMASSLSGRVGTVMRRFEQENTHLVMRIFELSPGRQLELLKAGELDIALIGHACSSLTSEIDLYELEKLPMCAVVPQTHPLADREDLHLEELREEPFVGLDRESFPGRIELIEEACLVAGFEPVWSALADGLVSLLTLVAQGKGVTIMPADASTLPHPHAVFIPLLDEGLFVSFHAAVRLGERRPIIESFLANCRQVNVPDPALLLLHSREQ